MFHPWSMYYRCCWWQDQKCAYIDLLPPSNIFHRRLRSLCLSSVSTILPFTPKPRMHLLLWLLMMLTTTSLSLCFSLSWFCPIYLFLSVDRQFLVQSSLFALDFFDIWLLFFKPLALCGLYILLKQSQLCMKWCPLITIEQKIKTKSMKESMNQSITVLLKPTPASTTCYCLNPTQRKTSVKV